MYIINIIPIKLISNLKSKKIIHENQKDKMNGLGMKNEIDSVEKYINDNYWEYSLIGNLLIRKMEEAPYVQAFYLGQANDEIKERISKNKKHGKKQENVPIFFVENIYFEYFERIKKLNNIDKNN